MVGRALDVPGLHNARDLGGLPLVAGGTTPSGIFIRAESPDLVTVEGWEHLRARGVRTVIDLRRPDERARDRTRRPDWATVVHVDLDDPGFADRHGAEGLDGAALHYLDRLRESPAAVAAALGAIGDAEPGAVLIHCVGGRDRTGLVAALLLVLAVAEPEAIVADYLETVGNAPRLAAAQGVPNWEPGVDRLLARLGTTTEASFRAFLAGLDVEPLLGAMSPDQATALRTWRGALG
ncbi:tyrosine-protein phosphatase [Amnibacterium setariae]|uniref:Tyrosine-protein phosphatase n=1 Tax=Amnibacterium setariae TaxID=2306585 RepID=A0A3A1U429_9MICO|nr:tyrosine-protein phosphatase [Amnibacterium setariae]RIX31080.1 tyrosine-protein phosphatase [Amnibacterium setariae]